MIVSGKNRLVEIRTREGDWKRFWGQRNVGLVEDIRKNRFEAQVVDEFQGLLDGYFKHRQVPK